MRPGRVILHIGRHKSGTSSLQRALASASADLRAAGALYPKAGRRGIAHHPLANAFLEKTRRDPAAAAAAATLVAEVAAEMRDWQGEVLLSSEAFQNVQRPERIAELVDPARCEIVVYLRELYGYAQSAYAQVVHAQRWSGSFTDYLQVFGTDYGAFLDRWEGFGPARLHVRPFHRAALANGDVIDDFAATAGLPPGILSSAIPDQNPSLGGALLEFKRALNGLPDLPAGFGSGYNVLSRLAGGNPAFRIKPQAQPDVARAYRRRFAEALPALTKRYPQLAVLAPGLDGAAPQTFDVDDFRPVWAALREESAAYHDVCCRAVDGPWSDDPALELILLARH